MGEVAAALAVLNAGLDAGKKANELINSSISTFNTIFGSSNGIWDKTRPLQINVVNMHPQMKLRMEDSWFDSGKFWSQPGQDIYPGQSATFYVCNVDGGFMTGVSGGVGFKVMVIETEAQLDPGWLICTFSNPYSGSIKGKVSFKGFGIKPQWESMDNDNMTKDSWTGFYKRADRILEFIFKEPKVSW